MASSKPIKDHDADPPCVRAKREYEDIVRQVDGRFACTGEYPTETAPAVMEFEIDQFGLRLKSARVRTPSITGGGLGGLPLPHGEEWHR